jgi:hypothetical protein
MSADLAMEPLLWRLADRFIGRASTSTYGKSRPEWFDHAGNLVVVDGWVSWSSPGFLQGCFSHGAPAGTYPVYVGTYAAGDRWNPDDLRYYAGMIVVPFAEPARIAAAEWDEGYDDWQGMEDYCLLWDGRAQRAATYPGGGSEEPTFLPEAKDSIRTHGSLSRRQNWVDVVVDESTGANAMVFPVGHESVNGMEARTEDGTLTCLVFTAIDY